jgi:hypothetical protein
MAGARVFRMQTNGGAESDVLRCPWCSAELPSSGDAACPSCSATLVGEADPQIPGLTTLAPAAVRTGRSARRPSRLMKWISGEPGDEVLAPLPAPGSLAPPSDDVRREILRLEIQAALADLTAEAGAFAAADAVDAAVAKDEGATGSTPGSEEASGAEPGPSAEPASGAPAFARRKSPSRRRPK